MASIAGSVISNPKESWQPIEFIISGSSSNKYHQFYHTDASMGSMTSPLCAMMTIMMSKKFEVYLLQFGSTTAISQLTNITRNFYVKEYNDGSKDYVIEASSYINGVIVPYYWNKRYQLGTYTTLTDFTLDTSFAPYWQKITMKAL